MNNGEFFLPCSFSCTQEGPYTRIPWRKLSRGSPRLGPRKGTASQGRVLPTQAFGLVGLRQGFFRPGQLCREDHELPSRGCAGPGTLPRTAPPRPEESATEARTQV